MVERSDEEKKRLREAYRRSVAGPMGPQGPMGGVSRTTGTVSTPTPKSTFTKIKDAAYGLLPQGAYGTSQTVGPLAAQMNPIPSLKRTFTGENAGKYLNFNNDLNWKQRLGLGLEDAINIGSVVLPGVRAVKAGPNALVERELAESIARYKAPELYDYGIHVGGVPNLKTINSAGLRANTGGAAGDALSDSTYFWRLSPNQWDVQYPQIGPLKAEKLLWGDKDLAAQASKDAQYWVNKTETNMLYHDPRISTLTGYLTKTPRNSNIFPDENFLEYNLSSDTWEPLYDEVRSPMPSSRAGNNQPLEVVDSTYGLSQFPGIEPGSYQHYNNVGTSKNAMENDVFDMIKKYARLIAENNKRIRYKEGMMPPSTAAERFRNNRR